MSEGRFSVADVVCLDCDTNMNLEIPTEVIDTAGISATLDAIETSECPVCKSKSRANDLV